MMEVSTKYVIFIMEDPMDSMLLKRNVFVGQDWVLCALGNFKYVAALWAMMDMCALKRGHACLEYILLETNWGSLKHMKFENKIIL